MKAFRISSRPVLESSIAAVDTFEAKQAATTRAAVPPRQQTPKIWPFLLQAAVVAVLFILFAWAAFKSESLGGDFGAWISIGLFLPAAMICEGLGLGKLSFFGSRQYSRAGALVCDDLCSLHLLVSSSLEPFGALCGAARSCFRRSQPGHQ
jgi:hypothetical protein